MASVAVEEPADLFGDEGDEGLFGDEDGDQSGQDRRLSDEELDSGDDDGRSDRAPLTPPDDAPSQEHGGYSSAEIKIPRQDVPRPTDGELHMFRLPKFLGVEPAEYNPSTFELPVADHHSSVPSANFSANATATTTVRFRKGASGKFDSNTLVNRWSDGTYTLLLGDTHYTLEGKPLAPSTAPGSKYQDHLDSHQYVATPYINSQLLHIIGHVTNQFTVRPNKEVEDQALARLESSLAAATRGRQKGDNKDGLTLIASNQDPELGKRQAEQAERDLMKKQRKEEAATLRAAQQAGRVRGATAQGLNLDELERRLPGSSKKKRSAPVKPRRARRRADYSSDEDEGPRGRNREDEYDLEDDFLAPSDEEGEEGEGGDESEEEIEEESEDERPKVKKQKTEAKAEADSDVDAEGEIDDAVASQEVASGGDAAAARGRRRLVIEDDEDE